MILDGAIEAGMIINKEIPLAEVALGFRGSGWWKMIFFIIIHFKFIGHFYINSQWE
ncbi:hypothetical protein [Psychrobacter faecalis]|uniref:hypothetical protein n=1 Tax=Psychrobacter faecalis TaxID=180588 RepID=UPI003FD3D558